MKLTHLSRALLRPRPFSEVMSLGFVEAIQTPSLLQALIQFSEVMSLGFVEAVRIWPLPVKNAPFSEVMSLGFVEASKSANFSSLDARFPR